MQGGGRGERGGGEEGEGAGSPHPQASRRPGEAHQHHQAGIPGTRCTMAIGGCLQTCQCMLFAQPFTGFFICFVFVSSRSTRSHLFSGGLTTTTIARFSW